MENLSRNQKIAFGKEWEKTIKRREELRSFRHWGGWGVRWGEQEKRNRDGN